VQAGVEKEAAVSVADSVTVASVSSWLAAAVTGSSVDADDDEASLR
jgi:hypothetical protein